MPDRADKFDADTLNPLLNPLLASHMGRWAEVYFTNPPEKREEAVSKLLRELEDVAVPEPVPVQRVGGGTSAKEETDTADTPTRSASAAEVVHTCSVCAYNNSSGHSFCGMCGAPLQLSPGTPVPQYVPQDVPQDVSQDAPQDEPVDARRVAEDAPAPAQSWHERSLGMEETIEPSVSSSPSREASDAGEANWRQRGKNPPRRGVEPQPSPNRYRLYVGTVVAILLGAFGYGAWRGTENRTDAGASSPPAAASTQPAPAKSAPLSRATAGVAPTTTQPASPVQNQNQAGASSLPGQALDSRIAPETVPVPAGSQQGGAGELATAEQYLNGTSGMTRDSGEASQWLWKAVKKRNVEAMLALSDLYLRGDGVPKSCDQARLLLDAAARKGASVAAERLRRLEASDCN